VPCGMLSRMVRGVWYAREGGVEVVALRAGMEAARIHDACRSSSERCAWLLQKFCRACSRILT